MKPGTTVLLALLLLATPCFAKVHSNTYSVPCNTLWSAVKDTLRNSGKYSILAIENSELTATYSLGIGSAGQKRSNSVSLNAKSDASCEMVVQSGFSGLTNDDAGDFKKRVDKSLEKLQSESAAPAPANGDAKKNDAKKSENQ
jgi:predicted DNA-binding WGR domain protein